MVSDSASLHRRDVCLTLKPVFIFRVQLHTEKIQLRPKAGMVLSTQKGVQASREADESSSELQME